MPVEATCADFAVAASNVCRSCAVPKCEIDCVLGELAFGAGDVGGVAVTCGGVVIHDEISSVFTKVAQVIVWCSAPLWYSAQV